MTTSIFQFAVTGALLWIASELMLIRKILEDKHSNENED